MGIDNVALKTFNSTGAQSVCRANEADSTQLIESQFLTKCTTEYINGSGTTFIPGGIHNLTAEVVGASPAAPQQKTETFYIPNDCDAISEIIWLGGRGPITAELDNVTSATVSTNALSIVNIAKIEVKIGNLTVQTILPGDIINRNLTELGAGPTLGLEYGVTGSNPKIRFGEAPSYSIPFTGRGKGAENSFLQAGAITNAMSLVFYYTGTASVASSANYQFPGQLNIVGAQTGLIVLSHQITKTEKDFISKNIINRVVQTSVGIPIKSLTYDIQTSTWFTSEIVVDLSSVNINVSHLLISIINRYSDPADPSTTTPQGEIELANATPANKSLLVSCTTVNLVLGNDRTGEIPLSMIASSNVAESFGLDVVNPGEVFILKTADKAFSTAGIPFSRINNKQLIIKFDSDKIGPLIADWAQSGDLQKMYGIAITACGTQIQTTVGGSTSFNS